VAVGRLDCWLFLVGGLAGRLWAGLLIGCFWMAGWLDGCGRACRIDRCFLLEGWLGGCGRACWLAVFGWLFLAGWLLCGRVLLALFAGGAGLEAVWFADLVATLRGYLI